MLNFTVGPVQSAQEICEIGREQVPYFRTPEFSDMMLQTEEMLLRAAHAPADARAVFLTGSGTASMEAAVINTLTKADKVLVVNGGTFGQRFVDLLTLHGIAHHQLCPPIGQALTDELLTPYDGQGYTAFVVNIHETSTGVHYGTRAIAEFCKRNRLFLIVDAISSFLADALDMEQMGADVVLIGSQKALACSPGISMLLLSAKALQRIEGATPKCMYLDLRAAVQNQLRGQTPFTPAVGILRQIHARLQSIERTGGASAQIARTASLAAYFRAHLQGLPFEIASRSMSNAVTPLHPTTAGAYEIFTVLKDEYGIWVCPNGGAMRDTLFRVGHIGELTTQDIDTLLAALHDMQARGLI